MEVLVLCSNPGAFAVYSEGKHAKQWNLHNVCSGNRSLGDMNDISLAKGDFNFLFADKTAQIYNTRDFSRLLSREQRKGKRFQKGATGVTIVDTNNDGFSDVAVSNTVGYLKFVHNNPSPLRRDNKFIKFILKGNGSTSNLYGIP